MKTEQDYYGVRVDTEKYAYLLRLNPNKGEYNLYCYCYIRNWLDDHIRQAERGIRFIDPHYKEKFRIRCFPTARPARSQPARRTYMKYGSALRKTVPRSLCSVTCPPQRMTVLSMCTTI